MRAIHFVRAFRAALRLRIRGEKTPLAASWPLSHRCNLRCSYCQIWDKLGYELDLEQGKKLIDDLAAAGTIWLSFSGGEPMLRKEVGAFIDYATERGMETSISTNGRQIDSRWHEIRRVGRVKISLDGPEDVHDGVRGAGSHAVAMRAAETCLEHGIPIKFSAVLGNHNLEAIDYLIDVSRQFQTQVMFQPTTLAKLRDFEPNPVCPDIEGYRRVVDDLIARKKKGCRQIANTLDGLRHIRKWPESTAVECWAGLLSLALEPDGTITSCTRGPLEKRQRIARDGSFPKAFAQLHVPDCQQCWDSGMLDLNHALSFRARTALALVARFYRRPRRQIERVHLVKSTAPR
ncbi:radical SAM protein [bacterium]|nr:radical SAM protein [bacterium]